MEKHQPLYIETLLDPFTVLKVCQLLREIRVGQSLEILVKGEKIPGQLLKVLDPEQYGITVEKSPVQPDHMNVAIKKIKLPSPDVIPSSDSGGCCS